MEKDNGRDREEMSEKPSLILGAGEGRLSRPTARPPSFNLVLRS